MKNILLLLFVCTACLCCAQTNLNAVHTWAYQLQNINPSAIAADTSFKLVIIDYSTDGTDDMKFSSTQISDIKNFGKKAISYISIGEAEDYRTYWQSAWSSNPPAWLGVENPDWPGNYKVKYWDAQWQGTIFGYIDTIVAQGFDGIYLDIIDAYYYWQTTTPFQPDADSLMIDFVLKIRNHVNQQTGNNNFIIIPQNGEDIISGAHVNTNLRNQFFAAINAVGIEDIFFPGSNAMDNSYAPDTYRLNTLATFLQNQIPIFSIEYLSDNNKIDQYKSAASAYHFVACACTRNLDQLCSGISLGINKEETIDLQVSPNPFSSNFFIKAAVPNQPLLVQIVNSAGENIFSELTSTTAITVNLESFSAGLYLVRISNGEKSVLKKLIKQ